MVATIGRSKSIKKAGRFRHLKKGRTQGEKKAPEAKSTAEPRFYSADVVRRPLKSRKAHARPTKLKASLVPGAVVILLAGQFRGKRAVFLKQLKSGLLLVTGPFKVNGVPLRRVNQAYVIGTSTRVDISKVKADNVNDEFFKRAPKQRGKKDEFFSEEKKKAELPAERKSAQKDVDKALLATIKKEPYLANYLASSFSLRNGQNPHELKF